MALSNEMKEMLDELALQLVPMVDAAVKTAVTEAGGPVIGALVAPVIDAVDSYVLQLLGQSAPANAVAAPTDTESRVSALEKHVASLTVASGHATSMVMGVTKVAANALPTTGAAANAPEASAA